MRATGSQNLRSGAQALRMYACGASAKWETVHAGQKEQRVATVSGTVTRDEAKTGSIAISMGYHRYSADCVRGYNSK
eukprot:6198273-Pleurochrysis_carterae.AAC.2